MIVLLLAISGALSNWLLRGGGLESAFLSYKNIPGLRYLNAFLFGIASYILSGHFIIYGGVMALAMTLGQLWKIPHQQTIIGEWKPMFLRGIVWISFIYMAVLVCVKSPLPVLLAYLPAALLMYPVYRLPILYFKTHKSNKIVNQVTVAEMAYGMLLWIPLLFVNDLFSYIMF